MDPAPAIVALVYASVNCGYLGSVRAKLIYWAPRNHRQWGARSMSYHRDRRTALQPQRHKNPSARLHRFQRHFPSLPMEASSGSNTSGDPGAEPPPLAILLTLAKSAQALTKETAPGGAEHRQLSRTAPAKAAGGKGQSARAGSEETAPRQDGLSGQPLAVVQQGQVAFR